MMIFNICKGAEGTVLLCEMQGWTATVDPVLLEWLLYREKAAASSDVLQSSVHPSASTTVGSSLPRHLSDVTLSE